MNVDAPVHVRDFGDGLAFDRSSVRSYGKDGHLHVESSNISKANVCPYVGREIPDFDALGLDPDKIYNLLRDPGELAKGAATFSGLPILSKHVPISAAKHRPDLVIGATRTASFDAPYLKSGLAIWPGDAIQDVESETKKELSSAYHYRADMTPGTYEGQPYDGVMRDIVGNHVALVKEGRAGADVVVGDSTETIRKFIMAKTALTRKAALVQGAVIAYLQPKLAQDAQIDLTSAFAGVTAKNFKDKKPAIVAALKTGTEGKLAQDADINDVTALLDSLDPIEPVEGQDMEASSAIPVVADPAVDADPIETIKGLLAAMSPEDRAKIAAMCAPTPAADVDGIPPKPAADAEEPKDMVTKGAMDEAIAKAVKDANETATKTQREIRDAERAVRPYVGDLAIAHDSAEGVYRTALKALNHPKAETAHVDALPAILETFPVAGTAKKQPSVAMDAAGVKSFAERFPEAARISL